MLKEAYGVKRIIMKTGKTDLRYGIDGHRGEGRGAESRAEGYLQKVHRWKDQLGRKHGCEGPGWSGAGGP